MQRGFDSVQMNNDFTLESSFPRAQTRSLCFKDKSVTFHPDTVSQDHEDFHEERMGGSFSCNN
jgi:hypothetical protein